MPVRDQMSPSAQTQLTFVATNQELKCYYKLNTRKLSNISLFETDKAAGCIEKDKIRCNRILWSTLQPNKFSTNFCMARFICTRLHVLLNIDKFFKSYRCAHTLLNVFCDACFE
jgi:hypothetical protein